jgi:hypothetical protein
LKRTYLSLILILLTSFGYSQIRIEGYVTPAIGYRHLTSGPLGTDDLIDSLKNADKPRQNWSGGIKLLVGLDKYTSLQFGVNYKGMSFTRVREDYQFHDTVHPKIGRIEDLSQAVLSKDAYFYHKYRYISIPVIFQKSFTKTVFNNKMQFYFAGGLDFDFLLKDDMAVSMPGWSVGGEDRHVISSDYESTKANVALNLGARFEYKLDEHSIFSVQPAFNYPLLLTAKDENVQFRMYQFGVAVGVSYLL